MHASFSQLADESDLGLVGLSSTLRENVIFYPVTRVIVQVLVLTRIPGLFGMELHILSRR